MTRRLAVGALAVTAVAAPPTAPSPSPPQRPPPLTAQVTVHAAQTLRRFRTDRALGGDLDGHEHGDTKLIYTAANLRAMGSAGLAPIAYRLRTELGIDAWHWNPAGRWSDERHHQGYWTSSWRSRAPIDVSYGYALPRRGDTFDQAENDGYSRLDDGDPATFWKSDPYLDRRYTHESDARHPQWVLVDLGSYRPVDAVRIDWAAPYATRFAVQWWVGPDAILMNGAPPEHWQPFPVSAFRSRGGVQTVRVAPQPVRARFVRILLLRGSGTAPRGSHDVRDRLGFAIRELGVGTLTHGAFADLVRHEPDRHQTVTMASSTDPWHTAADLDPNVEQPGLSLLLRSGALHRRPLLAPVELLYGTPGDAVAELRWLRARHVALRGLELGEEPDGQLASPEDYGALYAEFARALRRVDRRVPLGGPGYETELPDWPAWPDAHGDYSYTRRFLAELRRRGALRDLGFFSFEWYPFDDGCSPPGPDLRANTGLLAGILRLQRREGLPRRTPLVMTEYGYSAYACRAEVDLAGAVFDADTAARFLGLGGDASYLYGLEPDTLLAELRCRSWGNLILWLASGDRRIEQPVAALWAARMLTRDWAQPGDRPERLLATSSTSPDVGAYAVRRPGGRIALLLLDRSMRRPAEVTLAAPLGRRALDRWTLSGATYRWQPAGAAGHATLDRPPAHAAVRAGTTRLTLPPASVTVLRER